jgi:short-subunit dehydrogenase
MKTTESLTGVKITTLCPGAVSTPLFDEAKLKQFSVTTETALTPNACATSLMDLLQKKEYPCGSVLEITIAGTRLIPEWGVEPPIGKGSGQDLDENFMTCMLQPIRDALDKDKSKG